MTATIDDLVNSTTALTSAVNVAKTSLDQAVTDAQQAAANATANGAAQVVLAANQVALATTQANAAQANANTASSANTSAQTEAEKAAARAAEASAARDRAIAAVGTILAPVESLAAIAKSIHAGPIVKAIIDDTSKHSDGGAWRLKQQGKSWMTEAINGKWLGQAANEAAARAISGAAAGDSYQNSTDFKFYSLNAGSGQTEPFRGNKREHPSSVLWIAEANRLIGYSLDTPDTPMWLVIQGGQDTARLLQVESAGQVTSVSAINGLLAIGTSKNALFLASFVTDRFEARYTAGTFTWNANLAQRHAAGVRSTLSGGAIINNTINDIAVTVLPDAPLDPASGLSVPTVGIASAGGVSVIKHDGAVVNITATDNFNNSSLVMLNGSELTFNSVSHGSWGSMLIPASSVSVGSLWQHFRKRYYWSSAVVGPNTLGDGGNSWRMAKDSIGTPSGLSRFKENLSAPTKGMVAHITKDYSSGWQIGDSRGCWLADVVPEVITASGNLVANGDFADGTTTGWIGSNANSALSVVNGAMRITAIANGGAGATYSLNCIVGKNYKVTASFVTDSVTGNYFIRVGNSIGAVDRGEFNATSILGTFTLEFTATQVTHYLTLSSASTALAGEYFDVDNISVRLAEADRSVKNKSLVLNGTLNKAPVAPGAQLQAYSELGLTNYLSQPRNTDLEVGVGSLMVAGWVNYPGTGLWHLLEYGQMGVGSGISRFGVPSVGAGISRLYLTDGTVSVDSAATNIDLTPYANNWAFVLFYWDAPNKLLRAYLNGALVGSYTSPSVPNIVGTDTHTLVVGRRTATEVAPTSQVKYALVRISATVPSDDQIRHIYETERKMFQPGAKITIDGTSSAVTAMGYDEDTDILQVGTSWGRSAFKDLVRVESSATSVGAITSIAAGQGAHVTGGASAARYVQPDIGIRSELRNQREAKRAQARETQPFYFTGDGTRTDFPLPLGWSAKYVYAGAALKTPGTTGDRYSVQFDGFRETVKFLVAPGVGVDVIVQARRQ